MPSRHGPRVDRFYHSAAWRKCRAYIIAQRGGLCEICGRKGTEVHHIEELDEDNVGNPSVSLNPKNLQLLCKACHDAIRSPNRGRCLFDENGDVIQIAPKPPGR